jgi:hypothetical protein
MLMMLGDFDDVLAVQAETPAIDNPIASTIHADAAIVHALQGDLDAATQTNEIQQLGRIRNRVSNFLCEVRVGVLSNRDVIYVGDLRCCRIEAGLNCKSGKAGIVLYAIQAFLRYREQHLAILNDGGRCIRVKHIQAQN